MSNTVSSTDTTTVAKQIQDFKDGKTTISKTDLKNSVASAIKQGETPSSTVLDIIDSYEKIDTNGDGISYKELETYKNSREGLLSVLGMKSKSINNQEQNLFNTTVSGDATSMFSMGSSDDNSSFFNSGKLGTKASRILNNYAASKTSSDSSIVDMLS